MTTWTTCFQQHALHAAFDPLLSTLDAARKFAAEHEEVDHVLDATARLHHVINALRRRVSEADPMAVSIGDLDTIANGLGNISSHVDAFLSARSIASLVNANNDADALTARSQALPRLATESDAKSLGDTILKLSESSASLLAGLDKSVKGVSAQVAQISSDLNSHAETLRNEKVRLDAIVSQHQQQFSETQSKRQQAFDTGENTRRDRAEAAINEWIKRLSDLEQQSKETHEAETMARAKFDSEFQERREESTQQLVRQLEEQLITAKKIVGLIAGTGMAGGYQRDANVERGAFWFWSLAAVGSFIGMIKFAVALFDAAKTGADFDWAQFVGRFVAVAAFGVFASYSARMAKGHRESERKHRHKQLALESVNAFLNDLEPKVREEVKRKMADSFFMASETSTEKSGASTELPIKDLLELLKQTIARLR